MSQTVFDAAGTLGFDFNRMAERARFLLQRFATM
jgi:hypothetical protein